MFRVIAYCGLEVQKPTQALQSVKDYTNTLDRNPKWVSTWPSLIYGLKYLCGFLHLKPIVGCQISTLIFVFSFVERSPYAYPIKNILKTAKFFPTWGFNQRYYPGL
jgi:hypothetical protein